MARKDLKSRPEPDGNCYSYEGPGMPARVRPRQRRPVRCSHPHHAPDAYKGAAKVLQKLAGRRPEFMDESFIEKVEYLWLKLLATISKERS